MEKNKLNNKKYQKIMIAILLTVVLVGIGLKLTLMSEENQNNNNITETGEYENLNIDKNQLNIFYFYVGQADCTLITVDGCTMLIDSGNDSDGYYVVEFLKAQDIDKIDYFILTHYDDDHIGGAYKVLEELEIGVLYMPDTSSTTKTYKKLLKTIEDNDINYDTTITASNEITYTLGSAYWKVLSAKNTTSDNNSSIVIELYYNKTNYLFMGDAETEIEDDKNIDWDGVDVLKVAHHGSNSSTGQEFLDKINPVYAIISVGLDNGYNLPSEYVLERLKNLQSIKQIYRTDEDGTIWLTSDGTEIIFTKLEYNLDGSGRKQAYIYESKCIACFFMYHFAQAL